MSCGSTRNTNASAINLNAQPGNIINTPNADDGEILVFVESADGTSTDCSGAKGTWQNFKPLLFDIRSNTGHKYVDIGVSTATSSGGSYPVQSYYHRIASSAYSYPTNSFQGVDSGSHNEGLFGINILSKVDGGSDSQKDPLAKALAHLHIYSPNGPSLYLESGDSSTKAPTLWSRLQGNVGGSMDGTLSGYSCYAQRKGLVHSFEQADATQPVNFKPDQAGVSALQIWRKSISGAGEGNDVCVSIGKLNTNSTTQFDYSSVLGQTGQPLGTLQINADTPSLLLRPVSAGGNTFSFDSQGGADVASAPQIKLITNKFAFIRFHGADENPAQGHAAIYYNSDASVPKTDSTLNFVVYSQNVNYASDSILELKNTDGTAGGKSATVQGKLIVQNNATVNLDTFLEGELDVDGSSDLRGDVRITPGNLELGKAGNKSKLYLQENSGNDAQIILNKNGVPEWADGSFGTLTVPIKWGEFQTNHIKGNRGWCYHLANGSDSKHPMFNAGWSHNGLENAQNAGVGGSPDCGGSTSYYNTLSNHSNSGFNYQPGAITDPNNKTYDGYIYLVMQLRHGKYYWGGDRGAQGFINITGASINMSGNQNSRFSYRFRAVGDSYSQIQNYYQYVWWFLERRDDMA